MRRSNRIVTGLLLGGLLGCLALPAMAASKVFVPRKGADPNQQVSFSFQQADIDDVLDFMAQSGGKVVFKDPAIRTTITIRNQSRIPVSTAVRMVKSILELKGYVLEETEDPLIITTPDRKKDPRVWAERLRALEQIKEQLEPARYERLKQLITPLAQPNEMKQP